MVQFAQHLLGFLLVTTPVLASFERHVVRAKRLQAAQRERHLNDALLDVAVPLAEYEARVGRPLNDRRLDEGSDDFAGAAGNAYTFTGYALKYAKCQPIQYFSEDAIQAGEASPMLTEDIVVLRLCPQKSCSASDRFGCRYNYADYALTLADYMSVMLKYSAYRRDATCQWCSDCAAEGARRRLEEGEAGADGEDGAADGGEADQAADGGAVEEEAAADDAAANGDAQQENAAVEEGDDGAAADGDVNGAAENQDSCKNYNTYCSNYNSECGGNNGNYIDFEGYLDYVDCTKVNYNGYAYFVKPRCDGSNGAIKMAVFYDKYCMKYAGNDVSVKSLGLGFKDGIFDNYYSGQCMDCSDSEGPPYYDANSLLCNNIHSDSAKCTDEMMYDLFEAEADESMECSYIKSLVNGGYNQFGQFSRSGSGSSWDAAMTTTQAVVLGISIAICIGFILYACYLHHSMTNLLLKSLSHRELLPRKPRSRSGKLNRESSRRSGKVASDPDWEEPDES